VAVENSHLATNSQNPEFNPDNFVQDLIFPEIFGELIPLPTRSRKRPSRSASAKGEETPGKPNLPEHRVIRSARRKRGVSAVRQNGVIEIHIPERMSRRQEKEIVPEMIAMILRREAKARRGNDHLEARAQELLALYLPDFDPTHERPASITWRSMRERWGSCTTVDRTIRISDRLNGAPGFVLDCVIFHELIHLRIAGHDEDFYALMERFPDKSRAEAWLDGFEAGIALLPDAPIS
jgi:predicted metal-dependent hydrolase